MNTRLIGATVIVGLVALVAVAGATSVALGGATPEDEHPFVADPPKPFDFHGRLCHLDTYWIGPGELGRRRVCQNAQGIAEHTEETERKPGGLTEPNPRAPGPHPTAGRPQAPNRSRTPVPLRRDLTPFWRP